MSKKLLALILAALMLLSVVAGCANNPDEKTDEPATENSVKDDAENKTEENKGDEGEASDKPANGEYKIAVVPKMTNIGWFQRMEEGVKEYNEKNGTDYVYRGSAEGADQASVVEQMLAEDWDAICVVPFDSESLAPVLEKARQQGIVVITHEAAAMDPQYFDYDVEAFVNADYGKHFAEEIIKLTGGEGKYIQFVGDLNSVSHNEWCDAADEYFAENSKMEKIGRYETGDDTTSSYNQTKELLQAHPDITAIQGSASTDVVGAAQAVEELGLTGKVAVVGTSLTSIARNFVEKDVINTFSVWDPATAGQAMIELAIYVIENDGAAPDKLPIEGYESLTADGTVLYADGRVDVTKENLDDYDF